MGGDKKSPKTMKKKIKSYQEVISTRVCMRILPSPLMVYWVNSLPIPKLKCSVRANRLDINIPDEGYATDYKNKTRTTFVQCSGRSAVKLLERCINYRRIVWLNIFIFYVHTPCKRRQLYKTNYSVMFKMHKKVQFPDQEIKKNLIT